MKIEVWRKGRWTPIPDGYEQPKVVGVKAAAMRIQFDVISAPGRKGLDGFATNVRFIGAPSASEPNIMRAMESYRSQSTLAPDEWEGPPGWRYDADARGLSDLEMTQHTQQTNERKEQAA